MLIKIYIKTTDNNYIDYYYRNILSGYFNKLVSNSNIHNDIGTYNLSNIYNTKFNKLLLNYKLINNEGFFYFSTPINSLFQHVGEKLNANRYIGHGIKIIKAELMKPYDFNGIKTINFKALSPIVVKSDPYKIVNSIKVNNKNKNKFLSYNDDGASEKIKRIILLKYNLFKDHKLIGELDFEGFNVSFDKTYPNPKFKDYPLTKNKNIKGSKCPILITGNADVINFCINVGLGNNTKLGYGRITTN